MIENIIIMSCKVQPTDQEILFGDEPVHLTTTTDLSRLLVEVGVYKTTSEARRAGREGQVAEGWTDEFKASKKRRIWIWNPSN